MYLTEVSRNNSDNKKYLQIEQEKIYQKILKERIKNGNETF